MKQQELFDIPKNKDLAHLKTLGRYVRDRWNENEQEALEILMDTDPSLTLEAAIMLCRQTRHKADS